MPTRLERFDAIVAGLPRFSLPGALGVLASSWAGLVLYDLVVRELSSTPFDFDLLRALIPLAGFGPMFVRLLRPHDIADDAEAYETFVRLTTASIVLVGVTTLLRIVPFEYTLDSAPASGWSFLVGRAVSLVPLLGLPVIAEQLVRLLRYRSRRSVPRLAILFVYGFGLLLLLSQLFPIPPEPDLVIAMPATVIGPLMSLFALILAARARWIVNLRKRQKLAVLGLSVAGIATASYLMSLAGDSEMASAMASTFVGLPSLAFAIGTALLNVQLALFVHALMALPTAGAIDRRTTEVTSLATFGRLLTRTFDMTDLVETSIGVACDVTASRAAWIELEGVEGRDLLLGTSPRLTSADALRLMSARVGGGETLAGAARSARGVIVVDDVARGLSIMRTPPLKGSRQTPPKEPSETRGRGAKEARVKGEPRELATVAATPLLSGDALLGTLFVAKERGQEFDRDDLAILSTVADQIAMAMQHSTLVSSSIEREMIEQEMMIARDLQQRLLPRSMPESEWFDIHAESEPAHMVGGDYYDIVSFSDGTLGIVIADVSGKGPSAALYMGMIKGVIQALSGSTATPRELLAKINIALHGHIDQRWFATMTCAQIVEERRMLRVARAGHCPTLVVRSGTGEYRRSKGLGLAIARPLMFERVLELDELHFSPDDYVVFLSDGLPEARSPDGEEFGYERLMAIVTGAAVHQPSPVELRNTIFTELSAFTRGEPPVDDCTIVLMRWKSRTDAECVEAITRDPGSADTGRSGSQASN